MRRECQVQIAVKAPVEAVRNVVSDITRVGEWSGECKGCEWVGSVSEPKSGARFRGRNRRGGMRWTRLGEIDVADPPKDLSWHTIFGGFYRDSTQ